MERETGRLVGSGQAPCCVQCQALKKHAATSMVPSSMVKLSLLSLLYLHTGTNQMTDSFILTLDLNLRKNINVVKPCTFFND